MRLRNKLALLPVVLSISFFSCTNSNPSNTTVTNIKTPTKITELKNTTTQKKLAGKFSLKAIPETSEGYNEESYLLAFQDVKTAVDNNTWASGFEHYTSIGKSQGRLSSQLYIDAKQAVSEGFNEQAYLQAFPDVVTLIGNPTSGVTSAYQHYNTIGRNDGWLQRNEYVTALSSITTYDNDAYNLGFNDVKTAIQQGQVESPYVHYLTTGIQQNRLSNPIYNQALNAIRAGYNEQAYILSYPDVEAAVDRNAFSSGYQQYISSPSFSTRLSEQKYLDTFSCITGNNCPPVITELIPETTKIGSSIMIGGKYFKTNIAENTVLFPDSTGNNTIPGIVTKVTNDRLVVTVPTGATSGKVLVQTSGGQTLTSKDLSILQNFTPNTITNISNNLNTSINATLGVSSNGIPSVVWEDKTTTTSNFDLFWSQSPNGTWATPANFTNISASGVRPKSPNLAIDGGGSKHLAFSIGKEVYYYGPGLGGAWAEFPAKISDASSSDSTPKIAFGYNKLHMVWTANNEIYYSNSSDTRNWTVPRTISNSVGTNSINPAFVIDKQDNAYVTWEEVANNIRYVYYTRSLSDQWIQKVPISQSTTRSSFRPSIDLDGIGMPSIAWEQDVDGTRDIFYSKGVSRDNPELWSTPKNITNTASVNSYNPKIASDGTGLSYVVWEEAFDGIFFIKQTELATNSWSSKERVSQSTPSKIYRNPSIAKDLQNNTVHIIWESNITNPLYDIYHVSKSTDAPIATVNRLAEINTNKGLIKFVLFEDKMPISTSNFINLANSNFYDNLIYHRYVQDFVIQGGDPTGTGNGGSGTNIPLEINPLIRYDRAGIVAMARTELPDTASSQYFITLAAAPSLNGNYAAFGAVYYGFEALQALRENDIMYKVRIVDP